MLEGHHLAWGASGRNGGGVRQQWSTELNIRLMQESIEICRGFAQELGVNIWMRQGGYLFLARSTSQLERMERAIALQNRCDVPTRLLDMAEAQRIVPELADGPFAGACYNPTDAIVFPWPFLWGYARAAARRGVEIHTRTPVTAIERAGAWLPADHRQGAAARAERILIAAGAWSRPGGPPAGPGAAHLARAPRDPVDRAAQAVPQADGLGARFRPLLLAVAARGGGRRHHAARAAHRRPSSWARGSQFLQAMAAGMVEVMPRLGHLKVVRQWAGPYDMSPDGSPIVGESPRLPGLYLCCGFVGHGFMMAPVVGRHYARHLLGQGTHPLFDAWRPGRPLATAADHEMNIG